MIIVVIVSSGTIILLLLTILVAVLCRGKPVAVAPEYIPSKTVELGEEVVQEYSEDVVVDHFKDKVPLSRTR